MLPFLLLLDGGKGTDVRITVMQKGQRSGKELYAEWGKHDKGGVLGAATHFTQSLSPEERKRLFEYDSESRKEGGPK